MFLNLFYCECEFFECFIFNVVVIKIQTNSKIVKNILSNQNVVENLYYNANELSADYSLECIGP